MPTVILNTGTGSLGKPPHNIGKNIGLGPGSFAYSIHESTGGSPTDFNSVLSSSAGSDLYVGYNNQGLDVSEPYSSHTSMTRVQKKGSAIFVQRGFMVLDFTDAHYLPPQIKITKAELSFFSGSLVGDCEITVGHLFNPHISPGGAHANNYDQTRHNNFCSAQTAVAAGSFAEGSFDSGGSINNAYDESAPTGTPFVYRLDNPKFLNSLSKAINKKEFFQMVIRNAIDLTGEESSIPTGAPGLTSATFSFYGPRLGATGGGPDRNGLRPRLRISFTTNTSKFQQGRGAFAGTDIRNSTGKGFGTF